MLDVKNDGDADVKDFTIVAYQDPTFVTHTSYQPTFSPTVLPAYRVTPVDIMFCVTDSHAPTVTFSLAVVDPPNAKPATLTVSLARRVDGWAYTWTVVFAIAFAVLVILLRAVDWAVRERRWASLFKEPLWPPAKTQIWAYARQPVYTEQTWSFSGSWATTVTALGAVLATVLAASGFLEDVVPGVDVTRFIALNIVFGGAVIIAPVFYLATSRARLCDDNTRLSVNGTLGGLSGAVLLTVIGVYGQLGTLGLLVNVSDVGGQTHGYLYGALGATAVIVGCYAFVTMDQLSKNPKPPTPSVRSAIL
jgi:MFS family permease